jgi:hypothetical protein
MTQSEFVKWLEKVLGDMPIDEIVSPEIMEHVDRVHLNGEHAAWNYAKEDAREPFTVTLRALSKTMFIIGYDAGREQARIDSMFGSGSGIDDDGADSDSGDDRPSPRGLLPQG